MISTKIWFKTGNSEILAIVKVFKTWKYYLKDYKYEVLVFTDHKNLQCFIDIKTLNYKSVYLPQKFSKYHFWIHYD